MFPILHEFNNPSDELISSILKKTMLLLDSDATVLQKLTAS
jgi:hypothetical protein